MLTVASLYAPLLAVAAPLAGLCLGPTLATLFGAAASAAPRGGGTETQAWLNSIMNGGAAAGRRPGRARPAGQSWRWPWPPRPRSPPPPPPSPSAAGATRRNAAHAPRPVRPD